MSLETLAELFATPPQATDADADPDAALRARWTAAEWAALVRRPDALAAVRLAFEFERQRRAGIAPACYTAATICAGCGPVPIWPGVPPRVLGCPWCFNRLDGLPIPKPTPGPGGAAGPAALAASADDEL